MLYQSIKHRAELKLSAKLYYSDHFLNFSLALFRSLRVKFPNKRAGKEHQKNETKVCKNAESGNLRYYDVSRNENLQRENEMESLSFEGFQALLPRQI